ncbi:hypothetical protein BDA96_09G128200 [Sorghum bicolor]|uniref:Uncharacterized protein n=1 Tax=Sorghum bicolor TaxID=4558 RepID=A0A921Q9E7_SORBI|nr:hypothetical protein BDA96_09G128200 [Sorghum bicolor]
MEHAGLESPEEFEVLSNEINMMEVRERSPCSLSSRSST